MAPRRTLPEMDRLPGVAVEAGFGAAAAMAGALLRVALTTWLGSALPFLTLYPAVALASWAGGFVGGAAAIVVSVVLAYPSAGRDLFESPSNAVGLFVFVLAGLFVAWLGHTARRARADAEAGRDRARFIAEAARVLHEPTDHDATLQALARAVVPDFADWCVIDLFDRDTRFTGAIVAAPDKRQGEIAHEIRAAYPYQPDARAGVAWVARTGKTEALLQVPPHFFDLIPDVRLREMMESLGFRAYISAPMTLPGGRTLGVLTVVRSAAGRRFRLEDVEVAEDIARRTAVALDHAQLLGQTRARQNLLEAVIAAIPEAVLIGDGKGRVDLANRVADDVLGRVAGQPIREVIDRLGRVPGREELRVSASGRYLAPHVLEVNMDGVPVSFAVLVDRTEVVETEAARDAFVGMLSHELRTPITTIFAGAHLLRRGIAPDRAAEITDELTHETERLLQLIEDLLVLSRFEHGRLDASLEPLLASRVVTAAATSEAEQHPALVVTVDADHDVPVILGDETFLRQIVRNLLSNAAKYAGAQACVTIRVRETAGSVRVEFEDDGPGIDPGEAERIFRLFERLPTRGPLPGAGIGLFVCRRLAEVMGGTLELVPRQGPGACFVLELPAFNPDAEIEAFGQASVGLATP